MVWEVSRKLQELTVRFFVCLAYGLMHKQECGNTLFPPTSPSSIVKDTIAKFSNMAQRATVEPQRRKSVNVCSHGLSSSGIILWLACRSLSPFPLPWSSVEDFIPMWATGSICHSTPYSRCAAVSNALTHQEQEATAIASLLYLLEGKHYGKGFCFGWLLFSMSFISSFTHRRWI